MQELKKMHDGELKHIPTYFETGAKKTSTTNAGMTGFDNCLDQFFVKAITEIPEANVCGWFVSFCDDENDFWDNGQ